MAFATEKNDTLRGLNMPPAILFMLFALLASFSFIAVHDRGFNFYRQPFSKVEVQCHQPSNIPFGMSLWLSVPAGIHINI